MHLSATSMTFAFLAIASPSPPSACITSPYQLGKNTKGGDLLHFAQDDEDPQKCRAACCDNPSCGKWTLNFRNSTYVAPPCVNGTACCFLKTYFTDGRFADSNAVACGVKPPAPLPEPPRPRIAAGFDTYNVFWPHDQAEDGTVFFCTYLPTIVLANHSRLIAHGSCARIGEDCNGLHVASRAGLGANPGTERLLCQKHSDDGGRTWSPLRLISTNSQNGQIVWDERRQVLIAHWTPGVPGMQLQEHRSHDLGETWSGPRNMSFLQAEGPPSHGQPSFWASAGAALQLSAANPFHPGRIIFTGRMNSCGVFWYTDDGEAFHMSKNESGGVLCIPEIAETALAETPDGGILTSSRNGIFHGPGKCDCRATTHSRDGGDTFGKLGFDPALVEPECMATMINGGAPGRIFHANPGHGTDNESNYPPDGRASGTVRRTADGGKTWTSVVLNGDEAYSYSCLAKMPAGADFVGLIWETVLNGSGVPAKWSANNVVFTRVPQNFTVPEL
jgi:hypothetical protein